MRKVIHKINKKLQPGHNKYILSNKNTDVSNILGIACTGHGACISYINSDGIIRSSVLDRWAGTKNTLMFSRDELKAITNPESEVDKAIYNVLSYGFGKFPEALIFEDNIMPWFEWLIKDIGITADDIDVIVTSDSHFATCKVRLGESLNTWFPNAEVFRSIEHHEIHQLQAFWQSGLQEATVVTLDTCGDSLKRLGGKKIAGTVSYMNRDGTRHVYREYLYPENSSGMIYDITSHHIGFKQGQEGKTMGLAPYGNAELFNELVKELQLNEDGSFNFLTADQLANKYKEYVAEKKDNDELSQQHMNVAYAGQELVQLIIANVFQAAVKMTGLDDIVYAGGVALNSVANEYAYQKVTPKTLYVAPNPGDTGHSLGCVLYAASEFSEMGLKTKEMTEYLGPIYNNKEIEEALSNIDYPISKVNNSEYIIANCIANGFVIGNFDGAAEFGPRALGNRSILADPRNPLMRDYLNYKIKHREGFRPFAPSVLEEYADKWFDIKGRSSHMLRVVAVKENRLEQIPAITHIDGTARIQTVSFRQNERFYRIIEEFYKSTDVPLVTNTSFNIAGKPIVETPSDTLECFSKTNIDVLYMGDHIISKKPLEYYLNNINDQVNSSNIQA